MVKKKAGAGAKFVVKEPALPRATPLDSKPEPEKVSIAVSEITTDKILESLAKGQRVDLTSDGEVIAQIVKYIAPAVFQHTIKGR